MSVANTADRDPNSGYRARALAAELESEGTLPGKNQENAGGETDSDTDVHIGRVRR